MKLLIPLCLFCLSALLLNAAEPKDFDRLIFHEAPKALPEGAVTSDWPRFLGPDHDNHSPETKLLKDLSGDGPTLLWEVERGVSETAPVIAGDYLVQTHLLGSNEIVECLHPETGQLYWSFEQPVEVGQNYGISDAPRSSPVIDGDRVYTIGVAGHFRCQNLATGEMIWQLSLEDFGEAPFFFGRGSGPLVLGDDVIVNVGSDPCVGAFDKMTGELVWGVDHAWNASYASPVPATIHGETRVMVIGGGQTNPPHGGLLSVNPADGTLDAAVPWRTTNPISVLAASPVILGNAVFISEDYGRGSAMVEFSPDFEAGIRWEAPQFGSQFGTPIAHDGVIYGYSGSSPAGSELMALDGATGKALWSDSMRSVLTFEGRDLNTTMGRGSLIHVDDAFLSLGELGTLAWLELDRDGVNILSETQLFYAPDTFGGPALSRGLLYVVENGQNARLLCFDLRAATP